MQKILEVFWFELKRNIRRKGYLFATFGIPLLGFVLTLGFQVISSLGGAPNPIADFDFEGIQAAGFVDESGLFAESGAFNDTLRIFDDTEAAQAALDAGEIDVYYEIAADYLETGDVHLFIHQLSLNKINSAPMEQLFYTTFASDVSSDLIRRVALPSQY